MERWAPLELLGVCLVSISGVTMSSWKHMHVHLDFQLPTIPSEPRQPRLENDVISWTDKYKTHSRPDRSSVNPQQYTCTNTLKSYTHMEAFSHPPSQSPHRFPPPASLLFSQHSFFTWDIFIIHHESYKSLLGCCRIWHTFLHIEEFERQIIMTVIHTRERLSSENNLRDPWTQFSLRSPLHHALGFHTFCPFIKLVYDKIRIQRDM